MHFSVSKLVVVALGVLLLFSGPAYLVVAERPNPDSEPVRVLVRYLKALYARDYPKAYGFISAQDKRLKKRDVYVREHGAFSGFTLEIGRKLAEAIEARPLRTDIKDNRAYIKLQLELPDANHLSPLLLNWDEDRLNSLPRTARSKILASLDQLKRKSQLPTVEGAEEFTLVREGGAWRVSLDWASGVGVNFAATVPADNAVEARPSIKRTVVRSGELFNVSYRIKNLTSKEISARIIHRVEPKSLASHLDLVECALLLPVRISPGQEKEYLSTYLLQGDLPDNAKELSVTYEFQLER
jgi:hypothetical protein